jgi:hypothetical protein
MEVKISNDLPDYAEAQLKTYDYTRHKPECSDLVRPQAPQFQGDLRL